MANTSSRNTLFIVLFGVGLLVTVGVAFAYFFLMFAPDRGVVLGDTVAVVDIVGEIYYDRNKVDEILSYQDDDNVKAVVVFINSPGGGVAASQALFDAVNELRETKPVVASMASVAASGGYYVACAADSIMASPGTLTGSIGVIAAYLRTEELYHKIGLDVQVIKSGRFKDVGSPHREMTQEETAYLGRLLDSVYEQFVDAVSSGRDMPVERVRELAEGRLYTGAQAVDAGLVDHLGSYEAAVRMAARMGGIEGDPRVVKRRHRRSLMERILGSSVARLATQGPDRVSVKYIIP